MQVIGHTRKRVGEILEGIDAARFAGRDQRVQTSEVAARLQVADEEIILAPESHPAKRAFRRIVVERKLGVLEEAAQFVPPERYLKLAIAAALEDVEIPLPHEIEPA